MAVSFNERAASMEKVAEVQQGFVYDTITNGGCLNKIDEMGIIINDIAKNVEEIVNLYYKMQGFYEFFTNFDETINTNKANLRSSIDLIKKKYEELLGNMKLQIGALQENDATLITDLEGIDKLLKDSTNSSQEIDALRKTTDQSIAEQAAGGESSGGAGGSGQEEQPQTEEAQTKETEEAKDQEEQPKADETKAEEDKAAQEEQRRKDEEEAKAQEEKVKADQDAKAKEDEAKAAEEKTAQEEQRRKDEEEARLREQEAQVQPTQPEQTQPTQQEQSKQPEQTQPQPEAQPAPAQPSNERPEGPKGDTSEDAGMIAGRNAVNVARGYVDTPYSYGGTTESGIDCSALIQKSYEQIGVSLPRDTKGLAKVGTQISLDEARPGDIVFTNGGKHVVMVSGRDENGNITVVNASSVKGKVIEGPLNQSVVQVRRVN